MTGADPRPAVIDLFAGCGGGSMGFVSAALSTAFDAQLEPSVELVQHVPVLSQAILRRCAASCSLRKATPTKLGCPTDLFAGRTLEV
jgi:hypothetical protein